MNIPVLHRNTSSLSHVLAHSHKKPSSRLIVAASVFAALAVSLFAHGQSVNLGTVTLGTSSSATAIPLTFNTAATLGTVSIVTQGASGLDFVASGAGTCTVGTGYHSG